jgi:hypothetical protein
MGTSSSSFPFQCFYKESIELTPNNYKSKQC